MNRKSLILVLCVFFANILFTISAGTAYASSCFTDTSGHWAEAFICWMKNTGLSSGYPDGTFRPNNNITRAEVAALLYKDEFGDTYVNAGPDAWQVNTGSTPNAFIGYGYAGNTLNSSVAGDYAYQVTFPLISALHGQRLTVKGVKLCYDATVNAGYISDVAVYLTSSTVLGDVVFSVDDSTTRTDATCRTYSMVFFQPLDGTESLALVLTAHLPSNTDTVDVFTATAIEGFDASPAVLAPSIAVQPTSGTSRPVIGIRP